MSPGAISYSQKKLREIFNDDLLITPASSKIMELTQFAQSLSEHIDEALLKVNTVFSFKNFIPHSSERKFRIAMTEYTVFILLSKIYMHLKKIAPGVSIEIFPFDFKNIHTPILSTME